MKKTNIKPEVAKVTIEVPFGWQRIESAYAWRRLKKMRRDEQIEVISNPERYPCLVRLDCFINEKYANYLFLYIAEQA